MRIIYLVASLCLFYPFHVNASSDCHPQFEELPLERLRESTSDIRVLIRNPISGKQVFGSYEFVNFESEAIQKGWMWSVPHLVRNLVSFPEKDFFTFINKNSLYGCNKRSVVESRIGNGVRIDTIFDPDTGSKVLYRQFRNGSFDVVEAELILFCSHNKFVTEWMRARMYIEIQNYHKNIHAKLDYEVLSYWTNSFENFPKLNVTISSRQIQKNGADIWCLNQIVFTD